MADTDRRLTAANRAMMQHRIFTEKVLKALDAGKGAFLYPENINDIIEIAKTWTMTRDELTDVAGILANLNTGRMRLYRNGEPVELTEDEQTAVTKFLENW